MPVGLNPSERDPEFVMMRRRNDLLNSLIYPQTAEERTKAIRKAGRWLAGRPEDSQVRQARDRAVQQENEA